MTVQAGDSLLHYTIIDKLGEGGMGQVWRARDTTLDRDVAIKLLPASFAMDAERLDRFEREARVLASLSHPNIASIFGLHESDGRRFLAMELAPGEDLAVRLARGPIPIDDARVLARKIAEALEYAHERGIVHRDLKPANIKITPDGDVKVLDFGLAKAMDASDASGVDPMNSPTLTARATAMGVILGTAAYMSPEQARGKTVDKRADNWAFGCVLYEMLTGGPLFGGETITDILAAVVTREPDLATLPADTPASVRRLLERCFEKDPRARLRDIGEARIVLERPGADEPPVTAALPAVASGRGAARLAGVAVLVLLAGLATGRYLLAPEQPPVPSYEFEVNVPGFNIEPGSLALSPDGRRLALVVRDTSGNRLLAVRDLTEFTARILTGTTGVEYPFWSPDGREVAYFGGGQLYRVALEGDVIRPVATIEDPRGGTWGPGDIMLVGSGLGPIVKVAASGGRPPEPVTDLDRSVADAHAWPVFLPDGTRFLYIVDSATDAGHEVRLQKLNDGTFTVLRQGLRSQAVLDPAGRILVSERGQLLAYDFDLDTGELAEDSVVLAADVSTFGNQHQLPATVAAGGMLATQRGSPEVSLAIVDMAGRVTRTIGEPARYGNPRMSPDGKRVSFEIFTDSTERLVWAHDLERGVRSPVSPRGHAADGSSWSSDSDAVYFEGNSSGTWEIYRAALTGGGAPESLGTPGGNDTGLLDVSRDGKWVLAYAIPGDSREDLFVRSLDPAGGEWTPWSNGPAREPQASFSPDSRWIAYTSDSSGKAEVYVAPLDGGPTRYREQISANGGSEPRFSPDGKTLYYRSAAYVWTAVDIMLGRDSVEAGTPRPLFQLPALELPYLRNLVDVLPNGSGFLVTQPAEGASSFAIRVKTGK